MGKQEPVGTRSLPDVQGKHIPKKKAEQIYGKIKAKRGVHRENWRENIVEKKKKVLVSSVIHTPFR